MQGVLRGGSWVEPMVQGVVQGGALWVQGFQVDPDDCPFSPGFTVSLSVNPAATSLQENQTTCLGDLTGRFELKSPSLRLQIPTSQHVQGT